MRALMLIASALVMSPCLLIGADQSAEDMAVQEEDFAPQQLSGALIDLYYDSWSAGCDGVSRKHALLFYGAGGRFTEVESGAEPGFESVGTGTFKYERLSASEARITYHYIDTATWSWGDVVETLRFDSQTNGKFEGSQVKGNCRYSGRFTIKQ
jgi:hypothetical protein